MCSQINRGAVEDLSGSVKVSQGLIIFSGLKVAELRRSGIVRLSPDTAVKYMLHQSTEVSPALKERDKNRTLVKMCGITSAADAALAAKADANFIGMILWPNSKCSISVSVAKEISKGAKNYGAETFGVFVNDYADTILEFPGQLTLNSYRYTQLRGDGSRAAFPVLVKGNRVIYVLHAIEHGEFLSHIAYQDCNLVDWILVGSTKGGSGKGFDWSQFKLQPIKSKFSWLLAGGINPDNVSKAIFTLRLQGVDVSSGIRGSGGIHQDESRISSFMRAVNSINY